MISERKVTQDEMNEDRERLAMVPAKHMHAFVPGNLTPNADTGRWALKLYEKTAISGVWVFMYWLQYHEVDEDENYIIQ